MGLWVKSCEITKNLIKLDCIEITQFCLKIYDLWCMVEWVSQWLGSCQISNN